MLFVRDSQHCTEVKATLLQFTNDPMTMVPCIRFTSARLAIWIVVGVIRRANDEVVYLFQSALSSKSSPSAKVRTPTLSLSCQDTIADGAVIAKVAPVSAQLPIAACQSHSPLVRDIVRPLCAGGLTGNAAANRGEEGN